MTAPRGMHLRACRLLGIDPSKVDLVGPAEYKRRSGHGVGCNWGITTRGSKPPYYYVRRTGRYVVYVHELLHILFPSRLHKWVFAAAWKLTKQHEYLDDWRDGRPYGRGGALYADPVDAPESRARIIQLAQQAAHRKGLSP